MKQSKQKISRGRAPRNQKNNGDGTLMHVTHPPRLNGVQIVHSVVMRFVLNAAVASGNVTFQNLLDTFLVGVTATTLYDLFAVCKLRYVEAWATPILGQATTISVTFPGLTAGATGDNVVHTDTSMSIQPAHVRAKPSQRSLASDYQSNLAAVAMRLDLPAGAVIDVALSFKQQWATNIAAQNAGAGIAPGVLYLRGLDGLAVATSKYTPSVPDALIA